MDLYCGKQFVYDKLKLNKIMPFASSNNVSLFVTGLFIIFLVSTMSNLRLCEISERYRSFERF